MTFVFLLLAAITILGMGAAMTPATAAITEALPRAQQGVGSALNDLSREVGGALGTAFLNTVAATATASYLAAHRAASTATAIVHGFTIAMIWGTIILLLAAIPVAIFVTAPVVTSSLSGGTARRQPSSLSR